MDYAVIIISAEEKDAANELCGQISEGGENTFTIGLSPNGQLPITNYWCGWYVDGELEQSLINYFGDKLHLNPADPWAIISGMGIQPIQEVL